MSGMQKQAEKTSFKCVNCHSFFLLDFSPPEKWTVSRYAAKSRFKFICENCGAFIYPAELCGDGTPDEDLFYMFAGCINAYNCYLHDQYDPSCENPEFKPKCLFALYKASEIVNSRLEALEKRFPHKPPKKPRNTGGKRLGIKLN